MNSSVTGATDEATSPSANEHFVVPNSECANEMKCCFANEEVKCYKSFCPNNTCQKAYMPTIVCRAMSIRLTHCDCKDLYFRNDAGYCVTKKQCREKPELPSNPKCKGEHMIRVGCLNPKDYRQCPSQSSSRSCSSSSTSSSSSSTSSSCSSSLKTTPFESFIKRHEQSDLCLLDVCNCKPPYYLNNWCGKCVKKKYCNRRCHSRRCSGLNEELHNGKCICKHGYDRNRCEQCVPKQQLKYTAACMCTDPCPGKIRRKFNNKTQRSCENYLEKNKAKPTAYRVDCDCAEGYYSNSTGICVEPSECKL